MSSVSTDLSSRLGVTFRVLDNFSWKDGYVEEIRLAFPEKSAPVSAMIPQGVYQTGIGAPLFCLEKAKVKSLKVLAEEIHTFSISAVWLNPKDETRSTKPVLLDKTAIADPAGKRYEVILDFCDHVLSAQIKVYDLSHDEDRLTRNQKELFGYLCHDIPFLSIIDMEAESFSKMFTELSVTVEKDKDPVSVIKESVSQLIQSEIEEIDEYDLSALLFRVRQLMGELEKMEIFEERKKVIREMCHLIFTEMGGFPPFFAKLQLAMQEALASCCTQPLSQFAQDVKNQMFETYKTDLIQLICGDT